MNNSQSYMYVPSTIISDPHFSRDILEEGTDNRCRGLGDLTLIIAIMGHSHIMHLLQFIFVFAHQESVYETTD